MKRLSRVLGFEMKEGLPEPLLKMSRKKLLELIEIIGINWIANDGFWFQAVESVYGMNDAKRCNDSCWVRFSPFEAWSIKRYLGLTEHAGIAGLKSALKFRMYNCHVQAARKRRGLDDYPCKSVGLVEYGRFAEGIDSEIRTECVGCPPDPHPDEWFCAWRFSIPEK